MHSIRYSLTHGDSVPPLGVFLISGCSVDFLINILLTILGSVSPKPPLFRSTVVKIAELTSSAICPAIFTHSTWSTSITRIAKL
ncbi:hypothetical protein BJX65DRAFT_280511 [Aspergillus insuetus]